MKIFRLLLVFIISAVLFSSCKTQQKAVSYIEDYSDSSKTDEVKYTEPLIQKNDILSILIYSDATDGGKTDSMYNYTQGFLVDNDGNIQYPRFGTIKVEGITKQEVAETIRKKAELVLTNPTVLVRLLNFRITMLGEVAKPGQISLPGERITILEAIGLAGDVSVYGKKDDVVVIRDVNGKIEYGKIDMSSRNLFKSPYYYLRQNDVVLVNPNKNKARLSDQVFNQRLSIAFSLINTIALLYTIFQN
jgi:polysaccharide export outer membrane protein